MGLTFVEGFIVFTRMVTALAGAGDIFCGITGIDLGIKRYNEAKELAADDPTLDDKELKASALSIAVISSYLMYVDASLPPFLPSFPLSSSVEAQPLVPLCSYS
eukprot:TRINITY_DN17039_c0_g1_i1.p1 TRINITY_DN17039_c0_g1~~TRINITY_DN17039_c0_g1_i1.p1  ORF type:complete len:104 (-),score=26.76 TRINITY_DN17039_c0_g1_i1:94-405(-)